MLNEKNQKGLKRLVYGLITLFILLFLSGILDIGGKLLFALILLYFVLSVAINVLIFKSKPEGKLKVFLLLTGISSVVFSLGIIYGILGIWGFYSINDLIYLSSVIASWIGFMTGALGSIILLKNSDRHDAASIG